MVSFLDTSSIFFRGFVVLNREYEGNDNDDDDDDDRELKQLRRRRKREKNNCFYEEKTSLHMHQAF